MNCYLLIGGRSSRMGRPKGSVELGGRTFLERTMAAAAPVFDRVVAVQRAGEGGIQTVPTLFERAHPGSGAIFGLERAMEDAGDSRFWLLGIDYPLLTTAILRELRERFERSEAEVLVPRWSGELQFLCAGYRGSLLPLVRDATGRGRYALRGVVEAARGLEVVEEDDLRARHPGEPLLNVNDPETLERAASFERAEESRRPEPPRRDGAAAGERKDG